MREELARERDDRRDEVAFAEMKLRTCRRIGELVRELEKVETAGPSTVRVPSSGKPKADAIADTGLSRSEAYRLQERRPG